MAVDSVAPAAIGAAAPVSERSGYSRALAAAQRHAADHRTVRCVRGLFVELAQPLAPVLGWLFGVGAVWRAMAEHFEAMLREIERLQAALTARELVD